MGPIVFIRQATVFINGKRAGVGGSGVCRGSGQGQRQVIEPREADSLVFIALNKPVGIIQHHGGGGEGQHRRLRRNHSTASFPMGRLWDKDSLVKPSSLTNHGDLVNKILRAGSITRKSTW